MISVDTNVIVRLLTGDDQPQFKKAKLCLKKALKLTNIPVSEP